LKGSHKLVRKNTLSHERVSSSGQRLVAMLDRHAVNDNTYGWPARLDVRRGQYPVHAWHPYVHEHHIRLQVCNSSYSFVASGRLADYFEPWVRSQQGLESTAGTAAIVGDEEADRCAAASGREFARHSDPSVKARNWSVHPRNAGFFPRLVTPFGGPCVRNAPLQHLSAGQPSELSRAGVRVVRAPTLRVIVCCAEVVCPVQLRRSDYLVGGHADVAGYS
jgi:hypothetical protein